MGDKIEIAVRSKFGLCPICNQRVILGKLAYTAYAITEAGWIEKQLDKKIFYKAVCPKCGHITEMHVTERGLEPVKFKGENPQKKILGFENVGFLDGKER